MRYHVRRALGLGLFCVVVVGVVGSSLWCAARPSPIRAFQQFSDPKRQVAEDQIADPLILSGPSAVPIVLQHIEGGNMPNKRYAIHFLGNVRSKEALPTLERLLKNSQEAEYIRGDALQAIAMVDLQRGKALAEIYSKEEGYISMIARRILSEDRQLLHRRSYWDALLSRHD